MGRVPKSKHNIIGYCRIVAACLPISLEHGCLCGTRCLGWCFTNSHLTPSMVHGSSLIIGSLPSLCICFALARSPSPRLVGRQETCDHGRQGVFARSGGAGRPNGGTHHFGRDEPHHTTPPRPERTVTPGRLRNVMMCSNMAFLFGRDLFRFGRVLHIRSMLEDLSPREAVDRTDLFFRRRPVRPVW